MPPVDESKSDPLILLLDEIETLSAQTRRLEMSLKRAHADAFSEVEKFQQQFRAKIAALKSEFQDSKSTLSQPERFARQDSSPASIQNANLLRRLAEQQNLIQREHEECERRGAAIVALREQLSCLEAVNRELQETAAQHGEQAQEQAGASNLRTELVQKENALTQLHAEMSEMRQSAQANLRRLEEELASLRDSAHRQRGEIARHHAEREELRQRLAELESAKEHIQAQTARDLELARRDTEAKIAALQSEIAHKTTLLTQNGTTIGRLEQELSAVSASAQSQVAEKQTLLEKHAAEIARLNREIAELQGSQQRAAADELDRARETFATEAAALRAELGEKQLLLEQRQSNAQVEHELRNRYRELQGRLAAKESVIESQEHHLRNAQSELLIARDALRDKEQALAAWQTRDAEQKQHFEIESRGWQARLAESELKVESYSSEIERIKGDLAAALERQTDTLQAESASQEREQDLRVQIEMLTDQLDRKHAMLESQTETLRRNEAQIVELSASLRESREALENQRAEARGVEQDLSARLAGLRLELERKQEELRERDARASRAEPEFKAQIEDLQSQLQEKDRLLEARAREIGILQARAESLSGETARLEAAQAQALADAAYETGRTRQALQAEIDALQSTNEKHQTLLEDRQTALVELERTLGAEIEELKERSAEQQQSLETQTADLAQSAQELNMLRGRLAQLEAASHHAEDVAVLRANSDAERIAALERQLQSTQRALAEREAALQRTGQQPQHASGGLKLAQNQNSTEDQSPELKAAQNKITELLDRLAQLEAARHMLQENAAHELQQFRESFETRIANLRMEMAAKEQSPAQDPSTVEHESAMTRLEEGFQRQIAELQKQLAEQHSLLENRNEELIKVKAELDAFQDRSRQLGARAADASIDQPPSVELKEEDIVEAPEGFANGSSRPNPLVSEANQATGITAAAGEQSTGGELRSNRFTQIEGRVRSWNPVPEKDSAFGAGRRWNIAMFKRRWKA
jgi:chromosome segregation ATPase